MPLHGGCKKQTESHPGPALLHAKQSSSVLHRGMGICMRGGSEMGAGGSEIWELCLSPTSAPGGSRLCAAPWPDFCNCGAFLVDTPPSSAPICARAPPAQPLKTALLQGLSVDAARFQGYPKCTMHGHMLQLQGSSKMGRPFQERPTLQGAAQPREFCHSLTIRVHILDDRRVRRHRS